MAQSGLSEGIDLACREAADGSDAISCYGVDRAVDSDVLTPIGSTVGASTVRAVTYG